MAEQVAATMNHSQSDSELSESVDGEESDSSSSSSASSSSTTTSEGDADALELAKITNEVLRLPRGLCENAAIFREFFSLETWRMLPEQLQAQLHEHLPGFSRLLPPDEAALEHERSIAMLFSGQMQCFGRSPLVNLQRQLEEGNCRPDVLKLRESIEKSQRREQRFQTCERLSQLAKQLFVSREQLLRSAYKSAPDTVLKSERSIRRRRKQLSGDTKLCAVRARKRFYAEVEKLTEQLGVCISADEEDNDDNEADAKPNEAQSLNNSSMDDVAPALKTGSTSTDKCIYGTLFKRRHELPDEDAIRADHHAKQPKLSNRNFRQYLLDHKRRKLTEPALPDFETSDIRLRDVCARAQMGGSFKRVFASGKTPGRKPKSKLNEPPALVPLPKLEPIRKTEPQTSKVSLFNMDQHAMANHKSMAGANCNSQTFAAELNNSLQRNFEVCQKQELHDKSSLDICRPDDDSDPFNIMDGDVELQQEEVETYGTCEETIPAFVIANEIVLPQTKQSNEPEEQRQPNILSAGEGSKLPPPQQQQSRIDFHNLTMENLPKLEPIGQNKAKNLASPKMVAAPALAPLKKISSSSMNTAYVANPELIQETHACFFSLIRDFFCATPHHRMKFDDLKEKINVWLCNPITALNDWYAQAENWSSLLSSAINFLAGDFAEQPDEYVPFIEFKTQLSIYQWIGASRDSDSRLSSLCTYWMQRRNELSDKPTEQHKHLQLDGMGAALLRRRSTEIEDASNYDSGIAPPPPPRCPTTWTVRAATLEEVTEFQRQERERFEHPHRAYTYRMHGYESVVGPVKGIYSQILALTKARGHSMMIGDRPNFVTILTLVRDATARLPNGEGTRADISELLKCSQYINRDAAENVLQTIVSGALDRMHTEHDPCVRYDPKRKIWIYLHRNRSEDEFERMHQQHQGLSKHKKPTNRKQKSSKPMSKDGSDMEAMTAGVLTDSSSNHGTVAVTIAQNVSNTFSLPALVPANPIIVNSQNISNHHHQPAPQQLQQQSQTLPKCPPVPPLKYNIPNQGNQQQQKSLLKTTFHAQRIEKAVETSDSSQQQQQQQHHQVLAHPTQRNHLRIITTSSGLSAVSASTTNAVSTKHFSFSVPQAKNSSATNNTISSTTPIIVATPSGLQTVHVSNATSVTPPHGQGTTSSPVTATLGGKKVALNKPIIINQITQQHTAAKTKSPQIAKQLQQHQQTHSAQQQQHSLFIPISMGNPAAGGGSTFEGQSAKEPQTRNIQTIFMDNSAQLIGSSDTSISQQQQQAKNIIRLVPASAINTGGGTAVKTLVAAAPNKQQQQPMQIIGQRIIANTTVRPQQMQQKTVGGISIISSNANATAGVQGNTGGGGAIVKMSPQAFASFQQKQGQHILVKQTSGNQPQQQQRLVVGNTAIIAQSSPGGGGNKNILVQQLPQTIQKATIVNQAAAGSSVGSQTSGGALNVSSSATNKIQTINASNLTPQQQRVLLQNLKQQQQIQFKTVQQQQQQHVAQRNQALTILPQQQRTLSQQAGKTVAVVVSQPQGLTRILKTTVTSNAQQHQQQQLQKQQQQHIITQTSAASNDAPSSGGGTRVLTSSTGQIISLESLLQKQGGAIRITGGNKAGNQTTTNLIQLASSGSGGQQGQPQYAVVSQPRNIISLGTPHRLITTQAGNSANVLQTTTVHAKETTSNTKVVASTASGGRIFATSGNVGQVHTVTVPQQQQQTATKIFGKTTVVSAASGTPVGGGNIRVINAGTRGPATFNIANIQGKQLVFATKPSSAVGGNVKNITTVSASQAQQLQNAGVIFQGNANMQQLSKGGQLITTSQQQQPTSQMQTVIMGNQILRVQQMPQQMKTGTNRMAAVSAGGSVTTTNTGTVAVNSAGNEAILNSNTVTMPKTFVLGSASGLRLHSAAPMQSQVTTLKNVVVPTSQQQQQGTVAKSSPASRVVLAVQGGGQIFLSPSFQGGSLNLKSLQNMKVVSLAQQQQTATTSKEAQQSQKLTAQLKNSDSGNG